MLQRANRGIILMVDDDALLLEFFAAVLSDDYLVLTASSIEQAKDLLGREEVNALFCDLRLGNGGNGLELLAWLHANNPGILQRTTVLSGERIARPGGFDVPAMIKPVEPDELLQAAHQAINRMAERDAL